MYLALLDKLDLLHHFSLNGGVLDISFCYFSKLISELSICGRLQAYALNSDDIIVDKCP